jgi:hypothetical protein
MSLYPWNAEKNLLSKGLMSGMLRIFPVDSVNIPNHILTPVSSYIFQKLNFIILISYSKDRVLRTPLFLS